jgi:hypothetical protein
MVSAEFEPASQDYVLRRLNVRQNDNASTSQLPLTRQVVLNS